MTASRYTVVDHTGDFAFEVGAADLPSLVAAAVLAVADAQFGLESVSAIEPVEVACDGTDPEMLLFSALSEAVFPADARAGPGHGRSGPRPRRRPAAAAATAWTRPGTRRGCCSRPRRSTACGSIPTGIGAHGGVVALTRDELREVCETGAGSSARSGPATTSSRRCPRPART
jgi:hypothetical protein